MRAVWLSLCLFCACYVTAAVDLEKTMKDMAFEYKQAYETSISSEMIPHLERLIMLTEQALQGNFAADKAESFTHGLQQVLTQLQLAKAEAAQNNADAAKNHLREVDALRKDYHKQRKVSFWQLLFG